MNKISISSELIDTDAVMIQVLYVVVSSLQCQDTTLSHWEMVSLTLKVKEK